MVLPSAASCRTWRDVHGRVDLIGGIVGAPAGWWWLIYATGIATTAIQRDANDDSMGPQGSWLVRFRGVAVLAAMRVNDDLRDPVLEYCVSYERLLVVQQGAVDYLTLNRPERLNAIDPVMAEELARYFTSCGTREDLRVIVLRGAGRGFCAGVDIKSAEATPEAERWGRVGAQGELAIQATNRQFILAMRRCPQPIVAALHGPVCGAGFALALASDIRIASMSARMNCAFVNVGLGGCDIGVSYFLPRLVGASLAAELILTGRFIDASRAERLGLVSEVVEEDSQMARAVDAVVAELLRVSPLGLRLSKEALRFALDAGSLEAVIAMEDRNQVLCARTSDYHEATAAFFEKRAPVWRNA